jgi:hypothetical protein
MAGGCTQLQFDQTTQWDGACAIGTHAMYCTICCYARCVPTSESNPKCYYHTAQTLVPATNNNMVANGRSVCRSDPLFKLSDGTKFHVEIAALVPRDLIKEVKYDLHLPEGVKLSDVEIEPGEKCQTNSKSDNGNNGFTLGIKVIASEKALVQVTINYEGYKYRTHGRTNTEIYVAIE